MKYSKPEIAVLASANAAIQSQAKTVSPGFDNLIDGNPFVTNGAYEADE